MKFVAYQLELAIKHNMNLCSSCFELSTLGEGSFDCCTDGMIMKPDNLKMVLSNKIPKLSVSHRDSCRKRTNGRVQAQKRDSASGIRIGTKKYMVFELWSKGMSIPNIIKESGCNPSSVRSWVGRFKVRYGDVTGSEANRVREG